MAPDRRFGLPHPLDVEASEDSPRGKSGLWESLKRALGGPASEPTAPAALPPPDTAEPLPAIPPLPTTAPPADLPAPSREPPAAARSSGEEKTLSAAVPFLEEPENEPIADGQAPTALPPAAPSSPATPDLTASRLARGLASFSRMNADREKRFSHLLHDSPSARKKPRGGAGNG